MEEEEDAVTPQSHEKQQDVYPSASGLLDNGPLTPESFRVAIPSIGMRLRRVLDSNHSVGVGLEDEKREEDGSSSTKDKARQESGTKREERQRRVEQPSYSPTLDGESASELQSLESFGSSEDGLSRDEEEEDGLSTTTVQSSRKATYGAKTTTATNLTEANMTQDDDEEGTDGGYRIPMEAKGKWKALDEGEVDDSVAEVDLQDLLSPEPKYVLLPAQRAQMGLVEDELRHRRTNSGVAPKEKERAKVRIEVQHHDRRKSSGSGGTRIVYEKGLCAFRFYMSRFHSSLSTSQPRTSSSSWPYVFV